MRLKEWQELKALQAKAHRAARLVFFVLLALILLSLLAIRYGYAQTNIAPFKTPVATIDKLIGPNVNGEVYPATCGTATAPSWCSGTTADAWIRAACAQLPSTGGTINLLGLSGTIANSVTCSTPTKQVIMLADPTSVLSITENDGGIVFPLDNSSMFLGPGAGQCPDAGGIQLTASANVTAIVGPAHTDGTQEDFTASGLCLFGWPGATVSKGLIYAKAVFSNTTISNNYAQICNTSCAWLENVGGMVEVANNEFSVTSGVYSISGSGLNIVSSGSIGCEAQDINVHGGNIEHANGGANYPAINIYGNGSGAIGCSIYIHDLYTERGPNSPGTPSTIAIKVQDCLSCTFANIQSGGTAGGNDLINLSQTANGRVENVTFTGISNVYGTWTNTINDTTPLGPGALIPFATYPYVANYVSNPGYVQPPVLPGTTVQAVGADVMGGLGNFATGSGTLPTGFTQACGPDVTCTYTRTSSTAPPGATYSQEIQINTNTDTSSGYTGVNYGTIFSFTAGQQYVATFWGKGDGTFAGTPSFLLWNASLPNAIYCVGSTSTPFTTTWTAYSYSCTPTSSGSAYLTIASQDVTTGQPGATGTFYLGGFTFAPVSPLTPGTITTAAGPYSIGAATTAQQTITINSVPCVLGGSCTTGGGVPSVNTLAQPLVLSFSAGAGSCSSSGGTQTCTFTGTSTGGGSVTNFVASSGAWPAWLVPSVASSTTTPTLSITASAIPNSALANPSLTLGSTSVTLGTTVTTFAGITLNSPTFNGGAFGTPNSLTLTNATGLPWSGLTGSPSTSQVPVQSVTTSGTSGAATLIGGVLNIPVYVSSGGPTTTICSGTLNLGTSSIAAGAAATTVTATCSGLASTDDIQMDFNASPLGVVGYQPSTTGMLTVIKWPSTNTINVSVVNNTANPITPGAITLNYRVVR